MEHSTKFKIIGEKAKDEPTVYYDEPYIVDHLPQDGKPYVYHLTDPEDKEQHQCELCHPRAPMIDNRKAPG